MVYYFGKGRYQALYDALFEQLVPKQGPADSMQGELVRCISRLSSEYYRNGNINFYELDSRPFYADMFHYLRLHLHDTSCFDAAALDELNRDLATLWFFGTGDRGDVFYDGDNIREDEEIDAYDRIIERVIEWCRAHQNLLSREDERTLGITIASLFME